jgi:hypothetical protein
VCFFLLGFLDVFCAWFPTARIVCQISRMVVLRGEVLRGVLRGQHPGVLTGTRKKPAKVYRERVCYEAQKAREGVSEKVPGVPPGTFRERAANSNSGFPAQILSPEFKKPRKLDSKTTKNKNYIQVNNFQAQKHKNTAVILQTSVHSQTFTPPRKRQVIRSYLFHTALGEVVWNAGFEETGG